MSSDYDVIVMGGGSPGEHCAAIDRVFLTKPLAACVGEGAQVIATIHRYLGRSMQYRAVAEQAGRL